jgi:hypothetical protein
MALDRYELFLSYYKLYDDCFILSDLLFGVNDKKAFYGFVTEHEAVIVRGASLNDDCFDKFVKFKAKALLRKITKELNDYLKRYFPEFEEGAANPKIARCYEAVCLTISEAQENLALDVHELLKNISAFEENMM